MTDKCWGCKHNTLKLKVMVPQDQTIRECMQRTGNLLSGVVAMMKEKQEQQYTVWFRSGDESKEVNVKILSLCQLKIERSENDPACHCYSKNAVQNQISNIIYSKEPTLELTKPLRAR